MKRLSLRIAWAFCFIMSSLVAHAIDPLGSKVDFADDYNNSNFSFEGGMFLLVIAIIGITIYLFFLKFRDYSKNKPQKKTIKIYSSEWYRLENEERERKAKEEKEAGRGCIFGLVLFIGMIVWSIIQTDTEWLEAGKDLLITFGGLGILAGILLLISRIMDD